MYFDEDYDRDGKRYTDRGFRIYAEVKDSGNNTIRVQESSAHVVGELDGPFVWIFTDLPKGSTEVNPAPHLTLNGAKKVMKALHDFIYENEEQG